jgi:hypothetical protein
MLIVILLYVLFFSQQDFLKCRGPSLDIVTLG